MSIKVCETAIIGAGVTGLTLAYQLNKKAHSFVLIDKEERVGGVVKTYSEDGFLIEKGPNSAILSNTSVIRLIDELANKCDLEIAPLLVKKRYILKNNRLEALPNSLTKAIKTPLFSFKDKLRMLGEPFRKKGNNPNESLSNLVRRRLGNTYLEYAIDPFILGIYAGDPDQLVTQYAFPKLYRLEQDYGSFIKGALKKSRQVKSELEKRADKSIYSFKGGLQSFINALEASLPQKQIALGVKDLKVLALPEGGYRVFYQQQNKTIEIDCRRVVSTVGAYALPSIFSFISKETIQPISRLTHAPVLQISVGFKRWEGRKLDAFGCLVPHKEQKKMLGILFMSSIFTNRAPKGGALFSVFVGGVRRPEMLNNTKDDLYQMIKNEFLQWMGLQVFEPELFKVEKYQYAIPQYGIDSEQRLNCISEIENEYKGLIIAGNLRNGIGMADRIEQGYKISEQISDSK